MIGCFPDPYPGELLYSVCARLQARMRYPDKKALLRELFGSMTYTAAVDLPAHIAKLVSALPPRHHYSVGQFIDGNTLLPFYSPFLPSERVRQLRADMSGDGGLILHRRSGIMASRVPTPKWFRFCVRCAKEDRAQHGETYWHRLHQIPGVIICPVHLLFLETSEVRRDSARRPSEFTPAEDTARPLPSRRLSASDKCHRVMLKLARDSMWLIENPSSGAALTALYNRYLRLLIERGLATYTGSIHVTKLLDEFRQHYSPALLQSLGCEFTGSDQVKTNWLLRLARPPKHSHHPLYHLLLMQFLGHTAEEFFNLPTELSFFGEGPWPCLNPTAEHFREPVISECKLSTRLRGNRPAATFSCRCRFTYVRSGPDSSPADRFRIGRIISFGPLWEAKLKMLWKDSSMSLSEVGRQLGVDPLTVRRHAARLNLPASRPAEKSKPLKRAAWLKGTNGLTAHIEKRRACHVKWASAMRQAPKTTLKALRRKLPREYAWLLQNDGEWLKAHSPYSQRCAQSTSGVDWRKRDAEYALAVRAAAANLMNKLGRPVQVTMTAIGKALRAVTLLQQKFSKMPLTAQALVSVVETREQYATRRIWWVANLFIEERVLPRYWQLVSRANVYSLREQPEIKVVIEAATQKLAATLLHESPERAA